jgi:hypothetical protein
MASGIFKVRTPHDLFRLIMENLAELQREPDERRLLNCIVLANHLADWVWHSWLETSADRRNTLGLEPPKKPRRKGEEGFGSFQEWIESRCPEAATLRHLANGTKHFDRSPQTDSGMMVTALLAIGIPHHEFGFYVRTATDPRAIVFWPASEGIVSRVVKFWGDFLRERADWSKPTE